MKTQPQIQPEIACTMCDWTGMEADLTVPHHVLDDDMPDYGGHCPKCGEHSHDGNIVDFSEYKDMRSNALLSNEREYVEPYAQRGLPVTFREVAVTVLVVVMFVIAGSLTIGGVK